MMQHLRKFAEALNAVGEIPVKKVPAVVARPPSAAYKLQKGWQRNKLVFTAGVTTGVVAGRG